MTKTYTKNEKDRIRHVCVCICMQYLHDGKKEKNGIRRTYILIYILKKKTKARFCDAIHLLSCSCLMASGKSRTSPMISFNISLWSNLIRFFLFIIFRKCSSRLVMISSIKGQYVWISMQTLVTRTINNLTLSCFDRMN